MNMIIRIKKALLCLLAAGVAFGAAACTGEAEVAESTASQTVPVTTEASVPETTEPYIDYEILSARAVESRYFEDYQMSILVEFRNTGTCDMYLPEVGSTYALEDAQGNLVSAQNPAFANPCVLRPGEIGYLTGFEINSERQGNELTPVPRILAEPAEQDCVRFDVSDVRCIDSEYGVKVLGRVENRKDEAYEKIYIVCYLYDGNGILVDDELAMVENFQPGEKTEFETFGIGIGGVTAKTVADIVSYAYPAAEQE